MRCSFVLSGLGALLIFFAPGHPAGDASLHAGRAGVSRAARDPRPRAESDRDAGRRRGRSSSSRPLAGWVFVAGERRGALGADSITASWAVYALVLFLLGMLLHERRQRWCGLAILLAAILRVFAVDFWALSGGFRVLTFVVLTLRHAGTRLPLRAPCGAAQDAAVISALPDGYGRGEKLLALHNARE